MKGTFCRPNSRILAFIFSLRCVEFDAEAGGFEPLLHRAARSRGASREMGTRPTCTGASQKREGAGVVLDEHAEEALHRAEERAMHHDGLVQFAVFALVGELEALRAG